MSPKLEEDDDEEDEDDKDEDEDDEMPNELTEDWDNDDEDDDEDEDNKSPIDIMLWKSSRGESIASHSILWNRKGVLSELHSDVFCTQNGLSVGNVQINGARFGHLGQPEAMTSVRTHNTWQVESNHTVVHGTFTTGALTMIP